MDKSANIILTKSQIQRKLRRMAFEIYEYNAGEKEIVIAGIRDRGNVIADHLKAILEEIAPFSIQQVELELNKLQPAGVKVIPVVDFTNKVVVVIDDVANSGRTLLYALKPLLETLPRKIQTAVLVDRMHKTFPVQVDYIGYSLSTTLQDNIRVEVQGADIMTAYLDE